MKPALYLVAPVYDEAPNMDRLFAAFRDVASEHRDRFDVRVVLVDDGSDDGTADRAWEQAGELDLTVLVHPVNQGPGWAFGTAFEHLGSRVGSDDVVVTLEGDNTSRHELLRPMLKRAEEGHDAIFASPYMYGGGILHTQALRLMVSHVANTVVKEVLGVHGLLTVSSFYRLYRGECIRRLQKHYGARIIERHGYESMVEVVMKMMYLDMSISEVPMVLDTSRRAGRSKLRLRRTALGYFALYLHKHRWEASARVGR